MTMHKIVPARSFDCQEICTPRNSSESREYSGQHVTPPGHVLSRSRDHCDPIRVKSGRDVGSDETGHQVSDHATMSSRQRLGGPGGSCASAASSTCVGKSMED
eukprot:96241-Rhodomonas_salina.2